MDLLKPFTTETVKETLQVEISHSPFDAFLIRMNNDLSGWLHRENITQGLLED